MRRTNIHRIAAAFALVLSLVTIPSSTVHAGDPNQLFLMNIDNKTPAGGQMNIGTEVEIIVKSYADSQASPGTATGTLTYPSDKLQVTNLSAGGDGYNSPSFTQAAGAIGFTATRTSNPAPSGSKPIFRVKFKAIGSGTGAVSFTSDSKVNGSSPTIKSAEYTITNPNPTPSKSSTPKPSSTPKTSIVSPAPVLTTPPTDSPIPSTGPVITPDPTGLIDTVDITSLYSSAKVSWNVTTSNSNSTFAYGFSTAQLDKKITPTKKADGTFEVSIADLSPGTRYIFYVTATGGDGRTGNYTSTIFTRGYPVTIKVTENNQTVTKGQIRIGTSSTQINSNGLATIGLAAGSYTGTITTDTSTLAINLTVEAKDIPANGDAPSSQTFSFNLTSTILEQGPGSGDAIVTFILVLVGGSIALAMGFVGFMAYRRKKFESDGSDIAASYQNSGPSVVIDDGYTWHEQQAPTTQPTPTSSQNPYEANAASPPHNNSVYINDEEPVDMFDQASQKIPQLPSEKPTPNDLDAIEQNSSSPRSTTP